ncbi:MAG TPA: hypothetical protein PLO55_12685 [Thermotogota bacterium]|jgi:hypothetical protein|nr:hypothetical protein [Thermotogota bacterium]HQQ66983.1 hypothetical protein [Thermotogota bacterium]
MATTLSIEWGSTGFATFYTKQHIGDGDYEAVDPDDDSVEAFIESYVDEPAQLEECSTVKKATGEYNALFYADKAKYKPGEQYYLGFYWQVSGVQMCERIPVTIHTNI